MVRARRFWKPATTGFSVIASAAPEQRQKEVKKVTSRYADSVPLNEKELQATLDRLEIEGTSGAGMVKVVVNGKNETRRVEIYASLFKPEDKGEVEDLIVSGAVAQAAGDDALGSRP